MSGLDREDLSQALPAARAVLELSCRAPLRTLASGESCTGGMLAAALTAIPGSSASFLGGVIAYSNRSKVELLGVPESELLAHGAVSEEVAVAMAVGARQRLHADLGASTTGVAGPGSSEAKPVGLVFVAVAAPSGVSVRRLERDLGRHRNRLEAVLAGLELLLEALG